MKRRTEGSECYIISKMNIFSMMHSPSKILSQSSLLLFKFISKCTKTNICNTLTWPQQLSHGSVPCTMFGETFYIVKRLDREIPLDMILSIVTEVTIFLLLLMFGVSDVCSVWSPCVYQIYSGSRELYSQQNDAIE